MKSKTMSIGDFKKIGFEEVGYFQKDDSIKSRVKAVIEKYHDERVVYAFVISNEIKYIGVCNTGNTTLKKRMQRYYHQKGSGGNHNMILKIKRHLNRGQKVNIYALKITVRSPKYKGIIVDLVKGLENPLINKFNPEWNQQR